MASSDDWLSIGAVAERAGIASSSLRYYEREGLISADRTPSGQRRFRREVLRRLGPEVYITFDVDGLDPSIMPATGTPEPGGLLWHPTLQLLRTVCRERRVVGFDVTELAPMAGWHAPDYLVARLVYKLMGYALAPRD